MKEIPKKGYRIMNSTTNEQLFSTKSTVKMAMFAAILCVSAYISIPLPNGSHIAFLNFISTLITLIFSCSQAFCITLIWMLLGMVGLPVFVGGQAGMGYLMSPWGGYNFAFLIVAILLPLIRGKKYNRIRYTIASLISVIIVNLIGTVWLMIANHSSFLSAFMIGFVPFIFLDVVKAIIAAQIVPAFRRIIS